MVGSTGSILLAFGSAYLGSETHPFAISADPSEKDFKVENIDIDKSTG